MPLPKGVTRLAGTTTDADGNVTASHAYGIGLGGEPSGESWCMQCLEDSDNWDGICPHYLRREEEQEMLAARADGSWQAFKERYAT